MSSRLEWLFAVERGVPLISPVCYCLFRFIATGNVRGWKAKLCCHLSILCCASFVFRELHAARRAPRGMFSVYSYYRKNECTRCVCHGDYGLVTVFPLTINYMCINKCLLTEVTSERVSLCNVASNAAWFLINL